MTATVAQDSDGGGAGLVDWQFSVADAALDALNAGDVLTQAYTIRIGDGHGGWVDQTVTITINGAADGAASNSAPVITSAVQTGAVTEIADNAAGENATTHSQSGAITFTDADAGDTHTASVAPQADGYLGTFALDTVNEAGGSVGWTFSVADSVIDGLSEGQVLTQKYDVTVDDGHGGTAVQTVTVTITGSNDAPVAVADADAGNEDTVIAGSVAGNDSDVDANAALTYSLDAPVAGLTLNADGSYSFDAGDAAYQSLAAGELADVVASYTATDEFGATANSTLTIHLTGANDVPVIGGAATGNVNEDANPTTLTTAGDLTINDADQGQSNFTAQASAAGDNGFGSFTLDADGHWTYSADNTQAAIQQLPTGATLTDSFTAVSADGTASQTVTVTLHGMNDAPTVLSIDNTSVNENAPGAVIGAISVTDSDPGETFTYQVDDERFEIANGNLKLKDGIALNYEVEDTVHLAISATDSGGASISKIVSIDVGDGWEGNAVDGYISGATVFADANNNGQLDSGEINTVTDQNGNFTLFGGTGPLVMQGGIDISTNLAFSGVMRAPEGSTVVTPLTTLVAAIAGPTATAQDIAAANAAVLQGLGLDPNLDLSTFDPIMATVSNDPAQQTQGQAAVAAAVQIQNTITQAASLLSGAGASFEDAAAAVVNEIATQVNTQAQSNQTLNLNDAAVLTNVITTAGTTAGANAASVAETASGAANVISSTNQVITDAAAQTGVDLLTTLAQVAVVAQGDASASLVNAGQQGTATAIADVQTNFTGSSLTDAVSAAQAGDVLGANASLNLTGTSGADTLQGGVANDTLSSLAGNDTLQGFGGDDTLDGGADIDKVVYTDATGAIAVDLAAGTVAGAGVGTDTLLSVEMVKGGSYADTFVATGFGASSTNAGSQGTFNEFEGRGGDDIIIGNGATRVSYLSATSGVTVNLGTGTTTGDASVGTDTFTGVGAARGSNFDDTLLGSSGNDQFEGRGGSDFINGLGGADRARYDFETAAVQVNLAAGTVTGGDAAGGQDTLRSIELIRGTNFGDVYDATGFTASSTNAGGAGVNGTGAAFNEFEGMGGNDTITGNGNTRLAFYNATGGATVDLAAGTVSGDASIGNDTVTGGVNQLSGSNFNDTFYGSNNGSSVSEVFEGRAGNDTFDGRGGFDQAIYNSDGAVTTGISVDMAAGTVTGDAAVGTDTLIAIESVRGTNFADTYVATGFTGGSADLGPGVTFNEFEGMGGNDTITGNGNTRISFASSGSSVTVDLATGIATGAASGTDTFTGVSRARGSNFNDTIHGDGAGNVVEGQGGNDLLDGRGGNDTLIGGQGADTIVYANGGGSDVVTDFSHAQGDKIDLTGVNNVFNINQVYALSGGSTINFGGGNTLTLTGVSIASLTAADFVFAANLIPTDIALSNNSIVENSLSGTIVGALSGTDPNPGEPLTFTLTDDAGGLFAISGGNLVVAGPLDYETATSYSVTVLVTDTSNQTYQETFSIDVGNVNEAPTDIAIDNTTVAENSANGTIVGALSSVDQDAGDTATYSLVDDAGGLFAISGGNLVVAGPLDYETATSHSVTVRVTDGANNTYDETFSIDVTDVNETPTDIVLDNAAVAENSPNGTIVGALSAIDPDAGDTATFTLTDDAGGLFAISGGNLVVAGALNYEAATSHSVTVRVTDGASNTYDKTFSIGVTDVPGVTATGDATDNTLLGGAEGDTLSGLDGNDNLQGFGDNDLLIGGNGRDRAIYVDATGGISVDLAAGTVTGAGVGTDTLQSIEMIRGSNFVDTLVATGFGTTSTNAASIGDNLQIVTPSFEGMGGDDIISGNGSTLISYQSATAGVTVAFTSQGSGTATGDASVGTDTFTGVQIVRGSGFDDTFTGSNNTGVEMFNGGAGNDFINGAGGFDRATYFSQVDDDVTGGITVNLAAGTVTGDASVGTDTLRNIESVRGTVFDDVYNATGFTASSTNAGGAGTDNAGNAFNEFEGMAGNDTITGNGNTRLAFYNATAGVTVDLIAGTVAGDASVGNDTITGGVNAFSGSQFDDVFYGSNNALNTADIFEGRGGDDTFDGRLGFDQALYNNDPAVTSGISVDMAAGTVTGDAAVGIDTLIAVESVRGTNFADTYVATGFTGGSADLGPGVTFNEFEGMGGNDTITGNGNTRISYANSGLGVTIDLAAGTASGAAVGTDTFTGVNRARGSNGNDTISGDGNNNVLEGQGGNDLIDGRGGNDTLTGGQGGDTFVYANGGGADTVTDFNAAFGDKVDLTGVSNVYSIADVFALASGSTINFGGGNTLTLTGITITNLNASNFVFAANLAPTDIVLSNDAVAENSANGTIVGSLSAVDPDAGDSATFTLTDDAGGLFAISGGDLVVAGALDYETATSHSVTVRVTDGASNTYDRTFSIGVTDVAGVTLAGDASENTLLGTSEADTLSGLDGNDTLQGFGDDDVLIGGNGRDRATYVDATGGIAVDLAAGTVSGAGVGADTLQSIELIRGGNFADTFDSTGFGATSTNAASMGDNGQAGTPVFEGMGGDDLITGNGATLISYQSATAGVTVTFTSQGAGTATGDASVGTDTFTGVQYVRGTAFADNFAGSNNTNVEMFNGGAGDDFINGMGGFDRAAYYSQFDDDVTAGITVNLAAGTVTGDASVGTDTLRSIESIRGSTFDDVYNATGFTAASTNAGSAGTDNAGNAFNEFEGMGGNDTITGNGNTRLAFNVASGGVTVDLLAGTVTGDASVGNDTITGGVNALSGSAFDDMFSGSNNAANTSEIFDGRGGNDMFDGRGGYDLAIYNVDTAVTTGISVDMAAGTVTGDAAVGTDTLIAVEAVRGTAFADAFVATGYTGASADLAPGITFNEFEGMGGNDSITGNGNTRISYVNSGASVTIDLAAGTASGAAVGTDTFTGVNRARGSNANDTIAGDGNNNFLEGQGGNDRIEGRGGNDTLTGGQGADTFVFTALTNGLDTVTDWKAGGGADVLEVLGASFGGLAANTAATLTLGADAASASGLAANSFFFDNSGTDQGTVYFDATGGSGADAVAFVKLTGIATLLATDFHIV